MEIPKSSKRQKPIEPGLAAKQESESNWRLMHEIRVPKSVQEPESDEDKKSTSRSIRLRP